MKRLFNVFAIFLLAAILLTFLSACAETGFPPNDQPHEQNGMYIEEAFNGSASDSEGNRPDESSIGYATGDIYDSEDTIGLTPCDAAIEQTDDLIVMNIPIGGDYRRCLIHSGHFHTPLDIFNGELVSFEDFNRWYLQQRASWTSPYGECLVNLSTFIEYFGITREEIQQLIDDIRVEHDFDITFGLEINLDVLFSGDMALIEEFYCIENEAMHNQMARARDIEHFSEILINLQDKVNVNTKMSRYFHDIWTFVSMPHPTGLRETIAWMQGLVDAGLYEKVNIVEFVHYFNRYENLTRETFERIVNENNMYLFTHYNLDIIFSGDPSLIASYYAIENEAAHTMQVQSALEHHISMYGQPDMSRMLD